MKISNVILAVALSVFAASSLYSSQRVAGAQAHALDASGTLRTSGSAVIRVQPDKATLRLGVQTFAPTPRESQAKNARIIENVIDAIRSAGVPAQDIATDYFALRPEYDYDGKAEHKVVGYWTDNTLLVNVRQVDTLSEVLAAALQAGATTVDDVTFSTSRLRELRDQAREMAVKAALEKAHGLASALDLRVGDVIDIQDNAWSYYYGAWSQYSPWANVQQNVLQAAQSPGLPPEDGEFSLGQIVVQAQVDLGVKIGR